MIPIDTCVFLNHSDIHRQQSQHISCLISCYLTWPLAGGWPRWNPFTNTVTRINYRGAVRGEKSSGVGPLKERRIDHQSVRNPMWSNSLWVQLSFVLRWGILFQQVSELIKCSLAVNGWFRCRSLYSQKCCKSSSFLCIHTVVTAGWSRQLIKLISNSSFCSISLPHLLAFIPFISLSLPQFFSSSFTHFHLLNAEVTLLFLFIHVIRFSAPTRPWQVPDEVFSSRNPFLCLLHISSFLSLISGCSFFWGFHTRDVFLLV